MLLFILFVLSGGATNPAAASVFCPQVVTDFQQHCVAQGWVHEKNGEDIAEEFTEPVQVIRYLQSPSSCVAEAQVIRVNSVQDGVLKSHPTTQVWLDLACQTPQRQSIGGNEAI